MNDDLAGPIRQDDGTVVCHECGNEYKRIGYHWSNGGCDYPTPTEYQQSIITGLMLGDGTLRTHTKDPFVQTYSINKQFLEWIDEELDYISTGVSLYRDADKSAQLSRDNGHPNADAENYHDVYVTQTRTMPDFSRYKAWYNDDDRKSIPNYLVLTPDTARVWYACDGSLNYDRRYPQSRPHATIGIGSDVADVSDIIRMFEESSLGFVPTTDESTIRFTVDETERFLEWIGDAPPGLEYKWETESLDEYESLRSTALESRVATQ